MDTFQICMAALIGILTLVLTAMNYYYSNKKKAIIKQVKSDKVEPQPTHAEDTTNDAAESPELEESMPPEAMAKCPFSYFEHIPGEVKKTEHQKIQKTIEESMTQTDKEREREVQQQQMQEIFKLMQGQEETFGISDINDMQDQFKMYSPNM